MSTITPAPAPTATTDLTRLPAADLILPADASEEDWLEVRSHGIGASDVSGILQVEDPDVARGVYKDRYQVWLDKTGQAEDWEPDRDHPAHIGNLLEPVLRAELSERLGVKIHVPGLYANRDNPVFRCTVDGIHTDPDTGELVLDEFKCNGGYGGLKLWADEETTPLHPLSQVQYSMHLLGIKKAIIFALAGGNRFERRDIDYDPELGQMIAEEVTDFWDNYVVPRRQPDPTALSLDLLNEKFGLAVPGDERSVDAVLALELAEEWTAATAAEKAGKQRKEAIKARVKALAQTAPELTGPDGEPLFSVDNDSTLRKNDLIAEHPEVLEKYGKTETVLDVAALKEADPQLWRAYRARSVKYLGK